MKVKQLMELLEDYAPDAEVLIASQPNWPFEVELAGVVARAECNEPGEDGDDAPESARIDGTPTDVFLVEGRQVRYGSKTPFARARRYR